MLCYRKLKKDEIDRELFSTFNRKQIVTKCWRKENNKWVIRDDPFIDDWGEAEYNELVCCLKNTIATGGFVYGAFIDGELKGFVSVEGTLMGSEHQYIDLSGIHVSQDARRQGIGKELFLAAQRQRSIF